MNALLGLAAARPVGRSLRLFFCTTWECVWPRPNCMMGEVCVDFEYDSSGNTDFRKLMSLDGPLAGCKLAHKWARAVFSDPASMSGGGVISLEFLLRRAVSEKVLLPMAKQLIFALSRQVECALADIGKSSSEALAKAFAFSERRIQANGADMDRDLFAYVSAGVEASLAFSTVGIATDKANPCSGSFFNSVVNLPNNQLVVCCPQVCVARPARVGPSGDLAAGGGFGVGASLGQAQGSHAENL